MEQSGQVIRVFVGIPIEANNVTEMVREHPLLADLPVTWIRDEDLHITVIPPWNTNDVEEEKRKLQTIPSIKSFPLFFHTLETVPRGIPKLLWIQSHPSYSLIAIKQDVERIFGKEPENRPFLPHITLARFIEGRQSNYVNPVREPFAWGVSINSICLYQSHTGSGGTWYEKIKEQSLK